MTIDIARASYNPSRPWRAVLAQQGRVTLEADINEQTAIELATLRAETIDIIGPVGTPDTGYEVSVAGKTVSLSPGTIYLGGWRLTLPPGVTTATQPDWLDMPPWPAPPGNKIIALLAIEQTVTAVEDHSLREVALGGPDSGGRLTLLQHILEIPSAADGCAAAAADLPALLQAGGLTYDPSDCSLTGNARLQVSIVEGATNAGPCDPPATGGYLGADNQMIRVAITEISGAGGKLIWGWNNASFLFRATVGSNTTLILSSDPLDPDHTPQAGQLVEVLRSTVNLGDGNQSMDGGGNFIAAGDGKIFILGPNPYAAATRQLTLPSSLTDPPDYTGDGKRPLFVRLWTKQHTFVTGDKTTLGDTGIAVTITSPSLPSIGNRPFWHFAVRPLTPQAVYPGRYLHSPQPPDGPKEFITPLGVIYSNADEAHRIENCTIPFLPLTKLENCECCCLVVTPDQVKRRGGLQKLVDSLAKGPAIISLLPGIYKLPAPLNLNKAHANLTIESCAGGVTLEAEKANLPSFQIGLITIENATSVTLRGLKFTAPISPVPGTSPQPGTAATSTSCGMSVTGASGLTVEDCVFALDGAADVLLGVGIVIAGRAADCTLRKNQFTGSGDPSALGGVMAFVSGTNAATAMNNWDIDENTFTNLGVAMFCIGQFGLIRCRGNVVTGAQGGFIFGEANLGATLAFAQAAAADTRQERNFNLGAITIAALRPDVIASRINLASPILAALPAPTPTPPLSDLARKALADQLNSSGEALYKSVAAQLTQPTEPAAPAPEIADKTVTAPIDPVAYKTLTGISVNAEAQDEKLTPALRFDNNEITLTAGSDSPVTGKGTTTSGGCALGVYISPTNPGSVIVTGNRAVVPTAKFFGCALLFPATALVSGNLLVQLADLRQLVKGDVPCLLLIADTPAIMVGANVASLTSFVFPSAPAPTGVTTWQLLNTTIEV